MKTSRILVVWCVALVSAGVGLGSAIMGIFPLFRKDAPVPATKYVPLFYCSHHDDGAPGENVWIHGDKKSISNAVQELVRSGIMCEYSGGHVFDLELCDDPEDWSIRPWQMHRVCHRCGIEQERKLGPWQNVEEKGR